MINLEGIQTSITVNVDGLNKASRVANKFVNDVEKSFSKIGKSARSMALKVKTAASSVGASFRKMSDKANAAANKMVKTGAMMSAPLVLFANKAANMASDLEEVLSKNEVIFAKNSKAVAEWSKNSAKQLGMTRTAALDMATQYGGMLQGMANMTEEESSKMSTKLVQLAADMNSFNNIENAGEKIKSALAGSFEPLQSVGIGINDLILKNKALELGLYKGTGMLDSQAKALATLAVISEKTSKMQGDFARTSEGLANKQKIVKAQIANVVTEIGQKLLPLKLKLVNLISGLIDKWNGLSSTTKKWIMIAVGVVAIVAPLTLIVGLTIKLATGIALVSKAFLVLTGKVAVALAPFAGIVLGIVAAVTALGTAVFWVSGGFDEVEGWSKNLTLVEKASRLVAAAWEAIKIVAYGLLTGVGRLVAIIISLPRHAMDAGARVKIAFQKIQNAIISLVNLGIDAINTLIHTAVDGVNSLIHTMNKLPGIDLDLVDGVEYELNKMEKVVISTFRATGKGAAEVFVDGFTDSAAELTGGAIGDFGKALTGDKPGMLEWFNDKKSQFGFGGGEDKAPAAPDLSEYTNALGGVNFKEISENIDRVNNNIGAGTKKAAGGASESLSQLKSDYDGVVSAILDGTLDESLSESYVQVANNRLQAEQDSYNQQLEILNQAEAAKIQAVRPYHQMREELERQHEKKMQMIKQERMNQHISNAKSFFGNLASLRNSENKKARAVGKAAAIAEATINTYTSATAAYRAMSGIAVVGPYLGAAAAAAAIAAGMQNIAQIRSAKATGGNVFAGGGYRVNEQGPEMLSTSQGDFLMMGSEGGHITPANKVGDAMRGGGGGNTNVIVEVLNYGSANVEVEESGPDEEKKIRLIIDRTFDELNSKIVRGGNDTTDAFESTYQLNRNGTA